MKKPSVKSVARPKPPQPAVSPDTASAPAEWPAIGRIVIVLGRHPTEPAPAGTPGQHMPAIVTRVHSPELIDATLFPPGGAAPQACVKIQYGEAPGMWVWPRAMSRLEPAA